MGKIFWTTVFWIIVVLGLAFYIKMFDANMATSVSNWFGGKVVTVDGSGVAITSQNDVMGGISVIQTTLSDMQAKLNILVGDTSSVTPIPVVAPEDLSSLSGDEK